MRRIALLVLVVALTSCQGEPAAPDDEVAGGKEDDLAGTARGSKLPEPNAAAMPPADWLPPPLSSWPDAYVVFNNTGCGHDCTKADQDALRPRSVMIKMLVAAIRSVKSGGVVRVSNFNISASAPIDPIHEALRFAMDKRHATVKIVMDSAQDVADSRTNNLAADGAQVRFLAGMSYTSSSGAAGAGIMHSKMVIVDDKVIFAGSNNFSGSGVITNEENSIVLRAPQHADRIRAFTCQHDRMFEAGVAPGKPQRADDDPVRRKALAGLDGCETEDVFFPPSGVVTDGRSHSFDAVSGAIRDAKATLDLAPDMLAHPGLVSAIARRARKAHEAGEPFKVRLALDASEDALHNPAFGECLAAVAKRDGLDIEVRYWPGTADIFQLLHHKFMLVDAGRDDGALWNGSANYSAKALKWSFENVARYPAGDFGDVVETFADRFEKIWSAARTRSALAREEKIDVPDCPLDLDGI